MTDYTFMKAGFDNTVQEEDDTEANAIALILAFAENAMKTSALYVLHSKRRGVTVEDIKRAMMLEMFLFAKRPGIIEQAESIKAELSQTDEDEVEGAVDIDEGEEEEFKVSECSCAICSCMNGIYGRWEKWTPSTPMEEIFQKHINAIAP